MGLLRGDAVVLQTYPLSETDKIVTLYARKQGRLRGVARGARRMSSIFSGRLEPFHWIEFCGYERENQELIRIDKADLVASFSLGLKTYRSFLQLNVLAELLLKTIPDREPNEPLFRLLLLVLPAMRDSDKSDMAQLYFETWHLRLAGLFPASSLCRQCEAGLIVSTEVFYNSQSHCFFCSACKQGSCYRLAAESYGLLYRILRSPLAEILSSGTGVLLSYQCELARMVEALLQTSFERNLGCLEWARSES